MFLTTKVLYFIENRFQNTKKGWGFESHYFLKISLKFNNWLCSYILKIWWKTLCRLVRCPVGVDVFDSISTKVKNDPSLMVNRVLVEYLKDEGKTLNSYKLPLTRKRLNSERWLAVKLISNYSKLKS